MSADAQAPPPKVDAQPPIPESNWFWRRVFIWALCSVICIGVWVMVITMVNLAGDHSDLIVGAFVKIIGWLLLLVWFALTYYIVGTSGEQVVKIVQTASMFKQGIVSQVTQTASGSDGSTATAVTTTGPAHSMPQGQTPAPPADTIPAPPPEEPQWPA